MAKQRIQLIGRGRYTSGSLQKTGDNTYRLYLNYKEGDRYKAKTKTYRPASGRKPSNTAVHKLLDEWARELLEEELAAERDREAEKIPTVAEYLETYIELTQKAGKRTKSDYRHHLKKQIAPHLGHYRLDELTPAIVAKWVSTLSESYSPKTIRKAFVLFRAAMNEATERDVIVKNPCRTVEPPKLNKVNPNALGAKGRAAVINEIMSDPTDAAHIGYALALLMGMRSGEICALKWRYVDLEQRVLHIVYSLGRDNSSKGANRWYLKEPKTGGSQRTLDIPEELVEPLSIRLEAAKEQAAEQNLDYLEYFVIGFDDGSPMNGDALTHRWQKTAIALQLKGTTDGKRPTFHDLRHTWATKQVHDGTDIKTVSAIMGHSNAAMTLNIYTSADRELNKRSMQRGASSMFEEAERYAAEAVPDATGDQE